MDEENNERTVTSAIEDMSVAEVRKALSVMRKEWSHHCAVKPFSPSNILVNNMTISNFSFRFVMGHHSKRHCCKSTVESN